MRHERCVLVMKTVIIYFCMMIIYCFWSLTVESEHNDLSFYLKLVVLTGRSINGVYVFMGNIK